MTTAAAIKRLRSKRAVHYSSDGPRITLLHRTASGGTCSTTGRVIAETPHEVALIVGVSPVVVATKSIITRTEAVTGSA